MYPNFLTGCWFGYSGQRRGAWLQSWLFRTPADPPAEHRVELCPALPALLTKPALLNPPPNPTHQLSQPQLNPPPNPGDSDRHAHRARAHQQRVAAGAAPGTLAALCVERGGCPCPHMCVPARICSFVCAPPLLCSESSKSPFQPCCSNPTSFFLPPPPPTHPRWSRRWRLRRA